jgi:hypothetical protein
MKKNGLIESNRGLISLKTTSPDRRIPSFLREVQKADEKRVIAHHAISHVKDGMVIMLDASTTAYCMIPFLADFQSILVITSGAKAALALASYGINTICTGGKMISQSYSYVGGDAIRTLSSYNADVAFFSCHGLTEDGIVGYDTWYAMLDAYDGILQQLAGSLGEGDVIPFPGVILRLGAESDVVALMQRYLNRIAEVYPDIPTVTPSGYFGAMTEEAVIVFQRLFDLIPNGIVDAATWDEIMNVYSDINNNTSGEGQYPGYELGA